MERSVRPIAPSPPPSSPWRPLLAAMRRGVLWLFGGPASAVRAVLIAVCVARLLSGDPQGRFGAAIRGAGEARGLAMAVVYAAAVAGEALALPRHPA